MAWIAVLTDAEEELARFEVPPSFAPGRLGEIRGLIAALVDAVEKDRAARR